MLQGKRRDVGVKIAIMMLTFNRKEYSRKTLNNFERQIGGRNEFNFLIYDNGSTDGTVEYLKSYQGLLSIDVTFGEKNIGVAEGTKYLLREKCFNHNYDFIIKADDDELLCDGWDTIFHYWDEVEKYGAVFVGYRRKRVDDYFDGFKWISHNAEYMNMIKIGEYECYRSAMAPGFQISQEKWWQGVYPDLSDFGYLYGGWDMSLMNSLKVLKKCFLVIWNYESDHFQTADGYVEFEHFKKSELRKYKNKLDCLAIEYQKKLFYALERARRYNQLHPHNPEFEKLLEEGDELLKRMEVFINR